MSERETVTWDDLRPEERREVLRADCELAGLFRRWTEEDGKKSIIQPQGTTKRLLVVFDKSEL